MSRAREIRGQIRRLEEVPTLPGFFNKIVDTIADDRSSVNDLAGIISKDQALTAKILRLSNSAYYGRFRKVSTVEEAVTIVGFNEVKSVSLSVAVFGSFSRKVSQQTLESFWVHALSCATAVKGIGDRGQELNLEKVYFCGLLHDIGKLVLSILFGNDYLKVIDEAAREGYTAYEAEKRTYAVHHAQVGEWVAERWHFPTDLIEAIAYHHQPLRTGLIRPKAAATVYLANCIAQQPAIREVTDTAVDSTRQKVLQLLNMKDEETERLSQMVKAEEVKIREMLSLIS